MPFQIVIGLIVGALGFFQMEENTLAGCSALFVGGFLILAGIDRLWSEKRGKVEEDLAE